MQKTIYGEDIIEAKPFLKWAGGKSQLLDELEDRLPKEIKHSKTIEKYVEPFVGGGALFFYLKSNYNIKESYLYDINKELIIVYNTIKKDYEELISKLESLQSEFLPLGQEERKKFYLDIRNRFNEDVSTFNFENYSEKHVTRSAYTIFMNKTCFNGLFRLNKKGEFNVPMGKYKNPKICDKKNIKAASLILKDTQIINDSFLESEEIIDENTLVYLDPPYRPLNESSSFTSYSKFDFNDEDQIELANFYKRISDKGAKAILSNSDPKNIDENDNFFDDLYKEFTIDRVSAKRFINSNKDKRGPINEIIVTNF